MPRDRYERVKLGQRRLSRLSLRRLRRDPRRVDALAATLKLGHSHSTPPSEGSAFDGSQTSSDPPHGVDERSGLPPENARSSALISHREVAPARRRPTGRRKHAENRAACLVTVPQRGDHFPPLVSAAGVGRRHRNEAPLPAVRVFGV